MTQPKSDLAYLRSEKAKAEQKLCPCPECVRNAVLALGEVLGE